MQNKITSIDDLQKKLIEIENDYKDSIEISICGSTGCVSHLPDLIIKRIKEELALSLIHI